MNRATKVLFIGFFFISICAHCFAYDQVVYIWQRSWDGNVKDAITSIQDTTGYFTVLCGDLKFDGGKPVVTLVRINWDYLTQTETSTTVAFRINTKASNFIATDAIYSLADVISGAISKTITTSHSNAIVGIQIDYDCPTSKLSNYIKLISLIKKRFPGLQISFTALPTWLDNKDFPALAAISDYYVLQVHSIKVPKTLVEALKPFLGDEVSSWVKKASFIGHPFYVSLPTYGYEVSFTESGQFIGFRAETSPAAYKTGTKYAIIMTDPMRALSFLSDMEKEKPNNLLGYCWFRLPLKTDEFNWSIDTLKMVMTGKPPTTAIKAELVLASPGLYEVYVTNSGQTNLFRDICFNVVWGTDAPIVHDVISGYKEESLSNGQGVTITGAPPKVGNKVLVAWFRTWRDDINPFKVGEVEGYEK